MNNILNSLYTFYITTPSRKNRVELSKYFVAIYKLVNVNNEITNEQNVMLTTLQEKIKITKEENEKIKEALDLKTINEPFNNIARGLKKGNEKFIMPSIRTLYCLYCKAYGEPNSISLDNDFVSSKEYIEEFLYIKLLLQRANSNVKDLTIEEKMFIREACNSGLLDALYNIFINKCKQSRIITMETHEF